MTDNHASDTSILSGAAPWREWGRTIIWPKNLLRAEPDTVVIDGDEVSRVVTSLLGKAQDDWMTVRPGHCPGQEPDGDPIPIWPVPSAEHVRTRAIYESSYTAGTLERALIHTHLALGEEARVCDGVTTGIVIADATAFVVVPPDAGMLISDPTDVRRCRADFERLWEKSLPFGRPELPPQLEKVLGLLNRGYDVEQVAADMDISRCAVLEDVQDIRRRLSAGNMMPTRPLAGLRGWVY